MTEENLPDEEMEDFESLLNDAQDADLGDDAGLGGDDLDDIFGADGGGDAFGGDEDLGGGGDSDLDSFFEDLSTIDDLEVLQEDEDEPDEASEPSMDEEVAAPALAAAAAAVSEPEPAKEKPKKAPKEKKPRGALFKMIKWLVLLAIFAGGGYYVYDHFFPEDSTPWDVIVEKKDEVISAAKEVLVEEPPPEVPPQVVKEPPPPPPRPAPVRRAAPKERGPWSVQIASCFFPSCLENYRSFLKGTKRSVVLRERTAKSETLEIRSLSSFEGREQARKLADRINKAHPLEGHAYAVKVKGGYRISMGAFSDLSRAKLVKEALNDQFFGEIAFSTSLKTFPYKVRSVMTGRYPSRQAAIKALNQLREQEPRFKDAFVARNR